MTTKAVAQDLLWYKDAIIYEVHVKSFFDSNNDGIGDFPGITEKLSYVRDLGITCLWLLPFYPSPLRDDGYDIMDYEGINPSYGTLADFRRFIREAHGLGIRVVTELVINHTSDQHPWFQEARRATAGSSKRNFYVWSESDQKYREARIIFTDTEKSNWTWDPVAQSYYWHRFFSHQPDLNFDNPAVLRAILRILRFWLDLGVDGLRLDAIPYIIEREGTNCENLPETIAIVKRLRREVDSHYQGRVLLGEANQWPADVRPYFGDADGCHMAFHFPLMPRIFMAIQQEDRYPITDVISQTPEIPETCQWALFLRNHDELTLEMVNEEERDYMYRAFATEPRMRVNVGIRRRLAPLVSGNRRLLELLNSLLLSLPGTPVIYYGDEIAMGDNIYLGDRNGVRTPMQWTGDRNAGFSRANPAQLYSAPIMDPIYGYQAVNVEAQEQEPSSLLNWMRRMIELRKLHGIFGRGSIEFLHPKNRRVLAFLRQHADDVVLVVANLSRLAQPVELDLSSFAGKIPVEMLGQVEFPAIGELAYFITLGPYAFHWFRLKPAAVPIAPRVGAVARDGGGGMPVVTLGEQWGQIFDGVGDGAAAEILSRFMQQQGWFAAQDRALESARLVECAPLRDGAQPVILALAEVTYAGGGGDQVFLPLAVATGLDAEALVNARPRSILARLTGKDREGVLIDAMAQDAACFALLSAIDEEREVSTRSGVIRPFKTSYYGALRGPVGAALRVARAELEGGRASITLGNRLILKIRRFVEPGTDPDLEACRFLTERTTFRHVLSPIGGIELRKPDGEPTTLAMLQHLVPNQGNGWDYTISAMGRYLERATKSSRETHAITAGSQSALQLVGTEPSPKIQEVLGGYPNVAAALGRLTADLHRALGSRDDDPSFAPEPLTSADLVESARAMSDRATDAFAMLEKEIDRTPAPLVGDVRRLLDARARIFERFDRVPSLDVVATKIRCHGFFQLGQVLWVKNDFVVGSFWGDPAVPIAKRRAKQCALRDVAGMLRSFGYAAYAGLSAFTLHRSEEHERLESWAQLWHRWISATFVKAYLSASASASFIPRDRAASDALLVAFSLDQALTDLRFEQNYRPDALRSLVRELAALVELEPPATQVP